jgi:hypothetical protein
MKSKEILHTTTSKTEKKPDLRHGMHGSVMIKGIDAGQSSIPNDADLKLATPDLGVPVGQTTHE